MSRKLRHMTDVVTEIKDLSQGVTYEVLFRSGEGFRGELVRRGDRSVLGQVARFDLPDGTRRTVHAHYFESATPVT